MSDRPANPFPGLRPFEAGDTHLYFGCDGQSVAIIALLARTRFVGVVGSSGSGKSSLVRAGLLPQLEGGLMASAGPNWRIAVFTPGETPIRQLAQELASPSALGEEGVDISLRAAQIETVLRRGSLGLIEVITQARLPPGDNLLVVVDQFEELFRMARPMAADGRDDAAAFVALLLEARQSTLPIHVVLTMRSDYLGDCAQFRGLAEALNDGQYLVPRMTRDQRRQAIEGPVAVGGATIAPRLVQQMLNDVGDKVDLLPVLQHALMRTWEAWADDRRPESLIDLEHYRRIGTLDKALSEHAEEVLQELSAAQRAIARKVFQRLCDRSADYREARRRTVLSELAEVAEADEAAVAEVIDRFRRPGRAFLLPAKHRRPKLVGSTVIDISHESLIRLWDTLRGWVDEEANAAKQYRRLAEDAERYDDGELAKWVDPQLRAAQLWRVAWRPTEAWARRYHPGFASAMRFLDASVAARNRARIGWVVLLAGLPLALVGALAFWKYDVDRAEAGRLLAQKNTELAQKNDELEARTKDLGALAHRYSVQAVTLAAEVDQHKATNDMLVDANELARKKTALAEEQRQRAQVLSGQAQSGRLAVQSLLESDNESGALLAIEAWRIARTEETAAALWQAMAQPGQLPPWSQPGLDKFAISADGTRVATAGRDLRIVLWSVDQDLPVGTVQAPHARIQSLAVSADGAWVVSAGDKPALAVHRLQDGRLQRLEVSGLPPDEPAVSQLALARTGGLAATTTPGGAVTLWAMVPTPRVLHRLPSMNSEVLDLGFDRQGRWLAVRSRGGELRLIDGSDGRTILSIREGSQAQFLGDALVTLTNEGTVSWRRGPDFAEAKTMPLPGGRPARTLFATTHESLWAALSDGRLLRLKLDEGRLRVDTTLDLRNLGGGGGNRIPPEASATAIAEGAGGEIVAVLASTPLVRLQTHLAVAPLGATSSSIVRKLRPTVSALRSTTSALAFADGSRQLLVRSGTQILRLHLGEPKVLAERQRLPASRNAVVGLAAGNGATTPLLAIDDQQTVHRGARGQVPAAVSMEPASQPSRRGNTPARPLTALAPDGSGAGLSELNADSPPRRTLAWLPAAGQRVDLPVTPRDAGAVEALAVTGGGRHVAWATRTSDSESTRVEVWDSSKRRLLHEWVVEQQIKALAFSADGRWLGAVTTLSSNLKPTRATRVRSPAIVASRTEERRPELALRTWALAAGQPVQSGPSFVLNGEASDEFHLSFGAGGRWLLVGNASEETVDVLDWRAGHAETSTHRPLPIAADAYALSPDERLLATADDNRGVVLYTLEPGRSAASASTRRLITSEAGITVLSFSRDGRWLLGGGKGGMIHVWDATTQVPHALLRAVSSKAITALAVAADSQAALSGGEDGELVFWSLQGLQSLPGAEDRLCQKVTRNLNLPTWRAYMKDEPYRRTCPQAAVGVGVLDGLVEEALGHADRGDSARASASIAQVSALVGAIGDSGDIDFRSLCYQAALTGAGRDAVPLCQRALRSEASDGQAHEAHGIALALAGQHAKAARAFRDAMVAVEFPAENRQEVEGWVRTLEGGRNPFDAATLRAMRLNAR
ncbi:hypothetical protein HLB44_32985 [Aquincola sp. S2]|uniref:Novel STAND NTPase 1 domain-containing protein n=1 Tax=Pseudaquabacterium terrae TaxID=2732868 RepID=A0ABX2ETI2_9BURK|nr:hypothetical protein [Aquabacterium terrae]NRF71812.1 hypothetical protein [Aquabacterium terrae]